MERTVNTNEGFPLMHEEAFGEWRLLSRSESGSLMKLGLRTPTEASDLRIKQSRQNTLEHNIFVCLRAYLWVKLPDVGLLGPCTLWILTGALYVAQEELWMIWQGCFCCPGLWHFGVLSVILHLISHVLPTQLFPVCPSSSPLLWSWLRPASFLISYQLRMQSNHLPGKTL